MAHATNDINSVAMVAGGGVMSAVDASITALVATLFTMIFLIDFKLTPNSYYSFTVFSIY